MNTDSFLRQSGARRMTAPILTAAIVVGSLYAAACATAPSSGSSEDGGSGPRPIAAARAAAPKPDPRVGLRAGTVRVDSSYTPPRRVEATRAADASWNMRLVSNTPSPRDFNGVTNSDLAFTGNYAIQGNYNGFVVWDITNPSRPSLALSHLCPASQSDVSVYKNLLFVSSESNVGRVDCGIDAPREPVSPVRLRGIRIFDISDMARPRYVGNVQTCRGSHTHTVVTDPNDSQNVYIYISGSAGVRSPEELPGCSDINSPDDTSSSRFRIEIIRVPLANPEQAQIVSGARIFTGLTAPPQATRPSEGRGGRGGRGGRAGGAGAVGGGGAPTPAPQPPSGPRPGPNQCHDITVYPAIGLAGGACGGYGLLLDISNVANPVRIDAAADSNMSFWHSATFSNDGSKVLFSDEWGGGSAARCRATDKYEWGANALFTIENRKMVFKSYYKMPAAQTVWENCVAHNGSLIPIPGREVMVQAWYQGGISVFDWTDVSNPTEIAFYDRGPTRVTDPHPDSVSIVSGGSWSVYWYNGQIVSSEILRGLDIFALTPSPWITQNEIDAANTVRFEYLNAQEQPKITWPPSFALTRAYLDQLQRSNGLSSSSLAAARSSLTAAETLSGTARRDALMQLASSLESPAGSSSDRAKAQMLLTSIRDLANAR